MSYFWKLENIYTKGNKCKLGSFHQSLTLYFRRVFLYHSYTKSNIYVTTLDYPINREKLIAVHNMEHPQKVDSQEANNCLFLDIFYLF